jgi:hypothetical protein
MKPIDDQMLIRNGRTPKDDVDRFGSHVPDENNEERNEKFFFVILLQWLIQRRLVRAMDGRTSAVWYL